MTDAYILFHFRAFRIGQSRDVKVYRFISEATVEENIYLRQVYKQVTEAGGEEGERGERERVEGTLNIHKYLAAASHKTSIITVVLLSLATGQHGNGRQ